MYGEPYNDAFFAEFSEEPPHHSRSIRPHKDDGFPLRNEKSYPLWGRILAWSHFAHWYGSDWYKGGHAGDYYENGHLQTKVLTHDPHAGFEFSPVTPKQLAQVEESLGFEHQPLLRDLYLHVANGGFGPGDGLTGIPGGFCYWVLHDPRYREMSKEQLLRRYGSTYGEEFCYQRWPEYFDPIPFDLEAYVRTYSSPQLVCLAEREWPAAFFHLCGDTTGEGDFYVYAPSNHVYFVESDFPDELYTSTGQAAKHRLHLQATTLEEWFEHWLDGNLEIQYFDENLDSEVTSPDCS